MSHKLRRWIGIALLLILAAINVWGMITVYTTAGDKGLSLGQHIITILGTILSIILFISALLGRRYVIGLSIIMGIFYLVARVDEFTSTNTAVTILVQQMIIAVITIVGAWTSKPKKIAAPTQ
ncbi:MAG: hypothetical protein WC734_02695 [Patescibacteria group bacterium]